MAGDEGVDQDAHPGGRDAGGGGDAGGLRAGAAHQDDRLFRGLDAGGDGRGFIGRDLRTGPGLQDRAGDGGFQPGGVGRQDQAGAAARGAEAGLDGLGGQRTYFVRGFGRFHPERIRGGPAGDVAVQRGVVLAVIGGVVADDVDHRGRGAAGVVQVGAAVGIAGPEVQQGAGRLAGDAAVAVGGAGGDALEQAEHRAHARLAVQGRDKLHLAGARVGEAGLDAVVAEGGDQGVGAVHGGCLLVTVGHAGFRAPWEWRGGQRPCHPDADLSKREPLYRRPADPQNKAMLSPGGPKALLRRLLRGPGPRECRLGRGSVCRSIGGVCRSKVRRRDLRGRRGPGKAPSERPRSA